MHVGEIAASALAAPTPLAFPSFLWRFHHFSGVSIISLAAFRWKIDSLSPPLAVALVHYYPPALASGGPVSASVPVLGHCGGTQNRVTSRFYSPRVKLNYYSLGR